MTQFLISHGITPHFLYGIAVGMTLGLLTRIFEYFVT
jgi:hypothetical protein